MDMVPTLPSGWNVFLLIAVVVCIVIMVFNVRKEFQIRNKTQQETSSAPPVLPDETT
jgi:ABC-type uncharacterized transport system permease subunit